MIIYKTTNLINGKIYVGLDTKNIPGYLGSGLLIKRAIKKHGIENFTKEILEECENIKELSDKEIYWINKLNSRDKKVGYNIMTGGYGGDTLTNNPNIKEIKKKMSNSADRKGVKNSMYGKKHKPETIEKMKSIKIGKYDGTNNPTARKLYEYNESGNYIKTWEYCKEAADFYGISRGNISNFANINSKRSEEEHKKKLKGRVFSFNPPLEYID